MIKTMGPRQALLAAGAAIVLVATAGTSSAIADPIGSGTDTNVTATDILAALTTTPGVLSSSDSVSTTSDADSAAISTVAGTTVDIPRDPAAGVNVTGPSGAGLDITPPHAPTDVAGTPIASGVTAYPGTDGAATAVQATEDGGVRMLTVIDNADAPQDYAYNVSVQGGGKVVVNPNDGTASVLNADGAVLFSVAAPWATDAKGQTVPTRYTTDGTSLTQHIDHQAGSYTYPIKADPFWSQMGSYLKCITGVGVPIGAAIAFVAYVGLDALYVMAVKGVSKPTGVTPGVSTLVRPYVKVVYNNCRSAILR